jgi:hypothetical protein
MTGFPAAEGAGNILRAKTRAKIAIRLPPYFDCKESEKIVIETLTKDPPYNSKITVKVINSGNGWAAKDMHDSLKKSFSASSKFLFGKDYYNCGEGGSIPFIAELGELFRKFRRGHDSMSLKNYEEIDEFALENSSQNNTIKMNEEENNYNQSNKTNISSSPLNEESLNPNKIT